MTEEKRLDPETLIRRALHLDPQFYIAVRAAGLSTSPREILDYLKNQKDFLDLLWERFKYSQELIVLISTRYSDSPGAIVIWELMFKSEEKLLSYIRNAVDALKSE